MRKRVSDTLFQGYCRLRVLLMAGGDDRGTTMIEWAMMVTAIIVICAVAVQYMFGAVGAWFHWLGNQIQSFQSSGGAGG
jgi:Flp pilus assembly pilin Flp